jgi:alanine racemase
MKSAGQSLRSWVEIKLSAIRHNASVAAEKSGTAIMAVVKANAYGHGSVQVAQALQDQAGMFGVANLHEAMDLRSAGIKAPILLLSACLPEEDIQAVEQEFHVCVNSLEEATALSELAQRAGKQAHAHVVVDTGMGRMGFTEALWTPETIRSLVSLRSIKLEGIASHLPSPDEDATFTRHQIDLFKDALAMAKTNGLAPQWVHLANSAGLLGYDEVRGLCNLSRPGLMLYGVSPLPECQSLLRNVLTWKTRVTLVRELPAGHGVSYGRTFVTAHRTRVATLACGYADGYPRQVSGHEAAVLINGQRCPLLGRVTMDQMMVDVTALPEPPMVGAEAVLLGCQGEETITADELATKAGTIPWHIFTGIGARVERVYR